MYHCETCYLCAGEKLFDNTPHTGMAGRVSTTPGDGKRGGSKMSVVLNKVIGVKVPGGPIYLVLLHVLKKRQRQLLPG
jgi:hypothetical protein